MISEKGISGNRPPVRTLDFQYLRESGIKRIQELAGDTWTDYNLHDPGVTMLEVLCYALTDAGYRTERLRETYQSDLPVADTFMVRHLFGYDELIPSLPVTSNDFESYIEAEHERVVYAWVNPFPAIAPDEIVNGGYEVSVYLKEDPRYGDLNTDVIEVIPDGKSIRIEVILFDEENNRLNWPDISQIRGCRLSSGASDSFFQFEKHNAQVPLELDLKWSQNKLYQKVPVKARIAITGLHQPISKNTSIARYKASILEILETDVFVNALNIGLQKEHAKREILDQIRHSLTQVRGLCEDFQVFRVVNLQEIKLDMKVILETDAASNETMLQLIYSELDRFILSLVHKGQQPETRNQPHMLYTSNIIEVLTEMEGIRAVQVETTNLFVDGIPTISLQDEGSFDCLHLENFSRYIPRVSREKSTVTLVRNGMIHTVRASEVSAPFLTRSLSDFFKDFHPEKQKPATEYSLDDSFLEELNTYVSIQEDFPGNYLLEPGKLPQEEDGGRRDQQKRFKAYLLFFERLLIDYLERLAGVNRQLSLKQDEKLRVYDLESILRDRLPDVQNLDLIRDAGTIRAEGSIEYSTEAMAEKNRILDHLLARFGIRYKHLDDQAGALDTSHIGAKIRMLRDICDITRDRALGLLLAPGEPSVWGGMFLSGLQKRIYRMLGIGGAILVNEKLSSLDSKSAGGFYLVEHLLLVERPERNVFEKKLNKASSLIRDFLTDLNDGNSGTLPHSFSLTMVIPNWYSAWSRNKKAYEDLILEEVPAHIRVKIHWLDKKSLKGFEVLYEDWLTTLFQVYGS